MLFYLIQIYRKDQTAINKILAWAQFIWVPGIKNRFKVPCGIIWQFFFCSKRGQWGQYRRIFVHVSLTLESWLIEIFLFNFTFYVYEVTAKYSTKTSNFVFKFNFTQGPNLEICSAGVLLHRLCTITMFDLFTSYLFVVWRDIVQLGKFDYALIILV